MKRVFFLSVLCLTVSGLFGCVAATQNLETPNVPQGTATPNIPPLPTKIPVPSLTIQVPPPVDTMPTVVNKTPNAKETPITDETLLKLIEQAKIDLMQRADVVPDEITVKSAQAVEWRDSSLGCPMPGMMYAQMITPGYLIVLETNGKEYNYHASTTQVMYCEK